MAAKKDESYIVGFVLDFETGGLTPQTCAATQIAIHAIRLDTFEKTGSIVRYIYPYSKKELKSSAPKRKVLKSKYDEVAPLMEYQDRALEYSAITMDMLYSNGVDINQVAKDILDFMKDNTPAKVAKNLKPIVIGQNITFDEGFLLQIFEYTGLIGELSKILRGYTDFYGNWHPAMLDTIFLGQLALCNNPEISSYKLELMCEHLGIELNDAHDADADVAATANVAAVLTQRMRNAASNGDDLQINQGEKSRKHFKI